MEYDICSVSCYIIDPLFVTVLCCVVFCMNQICFVEKIMDMAVWLNC